MHHFHPIHITFANERQPYSFPRILDLLVTIWKAELSNTQAIEMDSVERQGRNLGIIPSTANERKSFRRKNSGM